MATGDIMIADGDICVSFLEDIATISGDDEILQSAIMHVLTPYGSLEFHPEYGNKVYYKRLKMRESDMLVVASDCMVAILQDPRIKSVPYIIAVPHESIHTKCNLSFSILTENGKTLYSDVAINFVEVVS